MSDDRDDLRDSLAAVRQTISVGAAMRPSGFAGRGSALRAASRRNPRNLPCPTCKQPNRLTPRDVQLGYQCDACADREEGGGY
jgi:hypothetical protein